MALAFYRLVVLFGGESEPALRRSVEIGDGWLGFNVSVEKAAQAIQRLQALAAEVGRNFATLDISVSPYSTVLHMTLDTLKRYRDLGVQRVVLINTTNNPARIDTTLENMDHTLVQPALAL